MAPFSLGSIINRRKHQMGGVCWTLLALKSGARPPPLSIQSAALQPCLFKTMCSKTVFPLTFVMNALAHLISSRHVHAAKLHPPEICTTLRLLRTLVLWRIPMLSFTVKSYRLEWERSSFPTCFWSLQNFV